METPFRLPSEMTSRKERVPLSTRVKTDTKETLEKAAKEAGLALSEFVANVLDDYGDWYLKAKKKR